MCRPLPMVFFSKFDNHRKIRRRKRAKPIPSAAWPSVNDPCDGWEVGDDDGAVQSTFLLLIKDPLFLFSVFIRANK